MTPGTRRIVDGRALRRAAALVAILSAATPAQAAPEPPLAPLNAWLVERSMPSAEPPTPAGRMRDRASDLVIAAMNFIGRPYQSGGSSLAEGFDCSGFTRHIFELSLGRLLPRRVDDQASASGMARIEKTDLLPGDLVFFNTLARTFSHVGIYVSDGKFIHSPKSGSEVRIDDMRHAYWAQRFTGARRAADLSAAGDATLLDTSR